MLHSYLNRIDNKWISRHYIRSLDKQPLLIDRTMKKAFVFKDIFRPKHYIGPHRIGPCIIFSTRVFAFI